MKVVLDTNVFISGVFFSGPPYQILAAWHEGKIQLVLSEKILDEYLRVAEVLNERFPQIQLGPILELLTIEAELTPALDLPEPVCADPDDDKFIECAIAGKAGAIISGDKHLLRASGYHDLEIMTPRKFIDKYIAKGASK
jgi:putative PIN family toxin of toxin-antitoxin system